MALAKTFMLHYATGESGINALSYAALYLATLSFSCCSARLCSV